MAVVVSSWHRGAAYRGEENKASKCSQVGTLNGRCQLGASSWFINPKGRVMGGWWAPPCSCSGKALVVSDVARWWDSEVVSFLCVLGTSCILLPPQSPCPSLSYCLCNKNTLLSSFKDWGSSCCKGFACVLPSALSILCTAPSTSSAFFLSGKPQLAYEH